MQIKLAPDFSLLAIVVIFLLNYLIVRRFFLKPINDVLESREAETKGADELYETALARFNEATAKMEAEIHAARRDASQVREHFRSEASTFRQQIVERTSGEGRQIVADAETALQRDVAVAREQIVGQSDDLATLAASRILGRAV